MKFIYFQKNVTYLKDFKKKQNLKIHTTTKETELIVKIPLTKETRGSDAFKDKHHHTFKKKIISIVYKVF